MEGPLAEKGLFFYNEAVCSFFHNKKIKTLGPILFSFEAVCPHLVWKCQREPE